MEITTITKNDIPRCVETFIASYNAMPWNHKWTLPVALRYLNEYADSPHFAGFMVCENGEVCGALLGHTKTWWSNKQFFVDELFIAPDKQGLGYGKRLLE